MIENLEFFSYSEFDSPDAEGSGERMQDSTLMMLEDARELADMPFVINSGYRTEAHNAKVGGKPSSAHTRGYAVDIKVGDGLQRMKVVKALMEAGFTRIGIARTFVHADNDPDLPQNVIWTY